MTAWAFNNELFLSRLIVDGKSNEITTIPVKLDLLDIEGCIIILEAIGTQREIASKIIENKAHYILVLKVNQGKLQEKVERLFRVQKIEDEYTDIEKNRGVIETRTCQIIRDFKFLNKKENWTDLRSIAKIISIREIGDKKTIETRLYISSLAHLAKKMNHNIRSHSEIENTLQWSLDMAFNEDRKRKRDKNAAENFAQAQKIALKLLKNENSTKISIKNKILTAARNDRYLVKLLNF